MNQIADETGALHPAVDVPVMLRSNFATHSLGSRAPLAGSLHRFTFHQHRIEVRLPDAPPRKMIGDPDMHGSADLWCYVWRSKTNAPVEYAVRRVIVSVDVNRTLTVPEASLNRVDPRHHSDAAKKRLDDVVKSAERI